MALPAGRATARALTLSFRGFWQNEAKFINKIKPRAEPALNVTSIKPLNKKNSFMAKCQREQA